MTFDQAHQVADQEIEIHHDYKGEIEYSVKLVAYEVCK